MNKTLAFSWKYMTKQYLLLILFLLTNTLLSTTSLIYPYVSGMFIDSLL